MIKNIIKITVLTLISLSVFGEGGVTGPRFDTSLDASIILLEYNQERAKRENGIAGSVSFNKVQLYRGDMSIFLDNKDKVFDSKIFVRKGFFGFKGSNLNLGFSLGENDAINELKTSIIKNTTLKMHSKQISVDTDLVTLGLPNFNFSLKNGKLFCKKHPSQPDLTTDAFVAGCLTEGTLNGKTKENFNSVVLDFNGVDADDSSFAFYSNLKHLLVKESSFEIESKNFKLLLDSSGQIIGKDLAIGCKKDPNYLSFNFERLTKICLNDVLITGKMINYNNKLTSTSYDLLFDKIQVKDQKLIIDTSTFVISNPKNRTKLYDLKVACQKNRESDMFDPIQLIQGCLNSSSIYIDKIFTDKKVETKEKASSIKDIKISVKNGKFELDGDVKWLFFNFDLEMYGTAIIEKSKDKVEIAIHVDKAKLPMGIRSKWLLFRLLKKYMVSDNVRIDKEEKYIYIDITPKEVTNE